MIKTRGGQLVGDIESPFRNIAFEYDGAYWHRNRRRKDVVKTLNLIEDGYIVIRLRETGLPKLQVASKETDYLEIPNVAPASESIKKAVQTAFKWLETKQPFQYSSSIV